MALSSLLAAYFRRGTAQHARLLITTSTAKTFFLVHCFTSYCYGYGACGGPSMLPTFEVSGDGVITSMRFRRGRNVKVGDIVAFDSVVQPGQKVIKRVVGLQGDYVLRDTPGSGSDAMLQVPEGHCWVIGDNLDASRDSRHFGPMPMALIRGKVIAKLTPFSERKWLGSEAFSF